MKLKTLGNLAFAVAMITVFVGVVYLHEADSGVQHTRHLASQLRDTAGMLTLCANDKDAHSYKMSPGYYTALYDEKYPGEFPTRFFKEEPLSTWALGVAFIGGLGCSLYASFLARKCLEEEDRAMKLEALGNLAFAVAMITVFVGAVYLHEADSEVQHLRYLAAEERRMSGALTLCERDSYGRHHGYYSGLYSDMNPRWRERAEQIKQWLNNAEDEKYYDPGFISTRERAIRYFNETRAALNAKDTGKNAEVGMPR